MKRESLLGHVIEILDLVRSASQPADGLVKEFFRARHYLGSTDRRYIGETVFGVLRNYLLLDTYVNQTFRSMGHPPITPLTPSIAWVAAYAIRLQGESIESYTVDIARLWERSASALPADTALRALQTIELPDELLADPVKRLATLYSMPLPVVEHWFTRFGASETAALCLSLNKQAPTAIRVNTLRTTVEECAAHLAGWGLETHRTPLSPFGLVLDKRAPLESLAPFREGWFEMQDEGSQLLTLLLNPREGMTIVDACAGAGGKALHAAALMANRGTVLALDVDQKRLRNLVHRSTRAGATCIRTGLIERNGDVLQGLQGTADAVLVDAPCSGVGTYRRNPGLKMRFGMEKVEKLARKQRSLLEAYAPLVKAGGCLVYATCTLMQEENEDVVEKFLVAHPDFRLTSASGALARWDVHLQFPSSHFLLLPHVTCTDGFFAAVMERIDGAPSVASHQDI